VLHSYAELVDQPRQQIDLKLSLDDAKTYISKLARFKVECIGHSPVKDSSEEAAANIQISDAELSKMFGKGDFENLRVIGQFNKGFIMCTLNNDSDLFILDQHACDEKFNFETLSRSMQLHS